MMPEQSHHQCVLWSPLFPLKQLPRMQFVRRMLLQCSVLPRCACWELPVCCWAAPDCFFSRREARRPCFPAHRPIPAASWVATHPGTLWTERTARWLNKPKKTYSGFTAERHNMSFHSCTYTKTNQWPAGPQLSHPRSGENIARGDILLLFRLFPPLITATDEGSVTASDALWLLIAVYWHSAALRPEGREEIGMQ